MEIITISGNEDIDILPHGTGTVNISKAAITAGSVALAALPYKDEDNMASDSAVHLATQQSIKAYVDSVAGAAADAELAAIAGLTSAANKIIRFTGSGTADLLDFKDEDDMASDSASAIPSQQSVKAYVDNQVLGSYLAVANDLSDLHDASTARTNLGLEIGTDVQAQDAELDALAGLTSAANKVPMFSGSGTASLLDFLDEDAMGSDSATAVASQQSIKAYADNNFQPLDANLTSIAALGTAADKAIYFTGVDTAAEMDITAAGRAILDDASASDQRTTLGLAIGTDVQAHDDALTSIAALGTAGDKAIYFSGVDTAAEFDLTAAGRAILDDASASDQRTTLGLAIGSDVVAHDPSLDKYVVLNGAGLNDYTDRATSGAVDESLKSFTLPANTLANDGDAIKIKVFGLTAANANNKTIDIKFGATGILSETAAANNKNFVVEALVIRTGAGGQKAIGHGVFNDAVVVPDYAIPAEDETGAITIDVRATTPGGAGDLTVKAITIEPVIS